MKIYGLSDLLHFGRYGGKTLEEVLVGDKQYIECCMGGFDHFVESPDLLQDNRALYLEFQFYRVSIEKLKSEFKQIANDDELRDQYDHGKSGEKYGCYSGWSEHVIDGAFEGSSKNT